VVGAEGGGGGGVKGRGERSYLERTRSWTFSGVM